MLLTWLMELKALPVYKCIQDYYSAANAMQQLKEVLQLASWLASMLNIKHVKRCIGAAYWFRRAQGITQLFSHSGNSNPGIMDFPWLTGAFKSPIA